MSNSDQLPLNQQGKTTIYIYMYIFKNNNIKQMEAYGYEALREAPEKWLDMNRDPNYVAHQSGCWTT